MIANCPMLPVPVTQASITCIKFLITIITKCANIIVGKCLECCYMYVICKITSVAYIHENNKSKENNDIMSMRT